MKNLFRLLVFMGVLATPQFLSADCTHAYGDCVTTSAWDVETCWYGDGSGMQTIYWCTGEVEYRPIYGGSNGTGNGNILKAQTVSYK